MARAVTGAQATDQPGAVEDEVITVDQRATAVDVIDICPACLRTMRQHAHQTCDALDAVEARLAYARLPFWRRLRTPAPKGWRVHTPAPEGRRS